MKSSEKPEHYESTRQLGVFDVVAIIVGIIIGIGIYQTPSDIAGLLGSTEWILFVWLLGGGLAFIGALCYAELASAYPYEGDYYFLHHTYGPWAGFIYAWGRLWVIHSGNIAMMAFIAGEYAEQLVEFPGATQVYALTAVVLFTLINCIGFQQGRWTQNIFASLQILGLTAVIVGAFVLAQPDEISQSEPLMSVGVTFGSFFLASIFVQLTFGGWSDAAFVASEVKTPGKNILRALLIGLTIVTVIYLLINIALLRVFGVSGLAGAEGIMSTMMERVAGEMGGHIMAIIVVICALASLNGMIIVGGRIYRAFGRDHQLFQFLAKSDQTATVPKTAFVMQGIISCVLILTGSFEKLVIFTAAAHWLFMALVGLSLILLRIREPGIIRPFRVPLYPFLPIIYISVCLMLIYSSFNYGNVIAPYGAWIGFGLVASGLPVYWLSKKISIN